MVRICPDGSELHTVIRVAARERRPNGAMAQLVARFHGMEEVGGSNPPSSTGNFDIRFRVSIFLLHEQWSRLWLQLGQLLYPKYNVSVSACGMFKICQT